MKPIKGTYPEYFDNYIPLVNEDSVVEALKNNWANTSKLLSQLNADKENYAYAPGKWTVKQVICHLSDTERIFAYRALRFARKDQQTLASFDENSYAANAQLDHRKLKYLIQEFETVRMATISLFAGFTEDDLQSSGSTAIGQSTVLALGFAICGHAAHHLHVLRERY
jgi:uncharacterized damage-inducible protein DinB